MGSIVAADAEPLPQRDPDSANSDGSVTVTSGSGTGGLPVYSTDQIADYLTHGYWYGDDRKFNLGGDRSLDVNVTALTSQGKVLARAALETWSDVTGISFREVSSSSADITFDDNRSGAFSSSTFSTGGFFGNYITSSHVNVSTAWLAREGTSLTSYSFQTYIHEIGHALGLGHAGDYNGFATYPNDASYANDSFQASIMSYFSETENSFVDANFKNVLTPQIADILAIQNLYGDASSARSGHTTYGVGATSDANVNILDGHAVTIYDGGGIDTINLSSKTQNQRLDLNAETFSDINGWVGNFAIARGTVIENAILGSGNDTVFGNDAANEIETGAGADSIRGGGGNDIIDGGSGADTAVFSGNSDDYTVIVLDGPQYDLRVIDNRQGQSDGIDLLTSISTLSFANESISVSSISDDGAQSVAADFNGDGHSNVLWRNSADGRTGFWDVNDQPPEFKYLGEPTSDWQIRTVGDFDGNGSSDILWQQDSAGRVGYWDVDSGEPIWTDLGTVSAGWEAVGHSGDFDGNNTSDLLWRNADTGGTGYWNVDGGSVTWNNLGFVDLEWSIVGTGDYNNDGSDDVLWRNTVNGQSGYWDISSGSVAWEALGKPATAWQVAGSGDFDGDGVDDIFWHNSSNGKAGYWDMSDGTPQWQALQSSALAWEVTSVGDYNRNGFDDILWRNTDTGQTGYWDLENGSPDWTELAAPSLDWDVFG